ncbi:TRAP transporter fused permease subunit [Chelativorans sp. AA-79]|uniref:TRAP transporter permease n=1 Tax=Chelativorans sp. AA-79 TaxID=3028735 RepID=UPI0023F96336|nr:TRAP transporter fused permease subunit [Chelativorans sp. AA-79]WEX10974.1 TRAP transporter fused permease subunit [Chelativorans sp. AA-79]
MSTPGNEGKAGFGLPPALWRPVASVLAICLTLVAVAWSLNLQRSLGLSLYPQQFLAAVLAFTLPLAFLMLPARRGEERATVPWYDCLLALLAFLAVGYVAVRYPQVVNLIFSKPPSAYVPGLIIVVLVLEALRRTTGWSLVVIIAAFLLYALFGNLVPGRLAGRAQDWQMLSGYMAFDVNGVFGIPMSVAATVVVAFILFGNLLGLTGGSHFFTDASLLAMGRFRGGSMKIAVLASGLFGSISGSAVANVTATGIVTIPMIKRDGYPAHKAGAIEAVASTGGQLMPPVMGAAAFLMAEFLQISYAEVALAALVPALLYYVALFIQADLEAARLGISRVPKSQIPPARRIVTGLHFILAFVVLIGALFSLNWQPERAALAAALSVIVTSLIFGYRSVRPKLGSLFGSLEQTGKSVVEIIVISAAAGLVIGVLNVTGLSFNLTYALVQIGGGSAVVLLVLSAAVCIVLGMGLPTLGVYVLLAALVAPALVAVGIEPIAAHLFVLYFGMMSMITPPIAIAAFAAASIASAPAMQTGWASVKFGWAAFVVPFLFVFSPTLLLIGAPVEIGLAVVTAGAGVWLVSAALAGYAASKLSVPTRLLFGLFGLMALVPAGAFTGAVYTDIIGVCGGVALLGMEAYRAREERRKALT